MKNKFVILILLGVMLMSNVFVLALFGDQSDIAPTANISCKKIFILEPLIVYEDAYNEQKLNYTDTNVKNSFDTEAYTHVWDIMSKSGFDPISIRTLSPEQKNIIAIAYDNLQKNSESLVKQWKDKSRFLGDFNIIQEASKADAILIQFVKVKVGAAGGFDFVMTGRVWPDTSTSSVKAILIELKTCKTCWVNSSFERSQPDQAGIKKLLASLYSNFPLYDKEEEK